MTKTDEKISIVIIGEGITEWFYFDSMRTSKRFPFEMKPDLPQHADIDSIINKAKKLLSEGVDIVYCVIDMDRINTNTKEKERYTRHKAWSENTNIVFIESMPCTELWFLLHFTKHCSTKPYQNYNQLIPDLQKHIEGYDKTREFLRKTKLHDFLCANGDIDRAISHAKQLCKKHEEEPENTNLPYTEIYKIIETLERIQKDKN